MNINPVTLEGSYVRLEPLTLEHTDALCEVGLDPELWRWTLARVRDAGEMRAHVEEALRLQAAGAALPFVTRERATNKVVGSTRFGSIDAANRRVEIGWTWVARPWQRSAINTEAKLLMLRHAFEVFDCLRVELRTDALNERSQKAILRLGAKQEGTLRQHAITASGRVRDTIYFSILASEWRSIESRLIAKLGAWQGGESDGEKNDDE